MVQHARDGRLAHRVGAAREFAEDAHLSMLAQPRRGTAQTLSANGGGDTRLRGSGAVGVEVLMHLIHNLVLRIRQAGEVIIRSIPVPRARPRVALHKNILTRRARRADPVNGRLVELQHERLVHVVVLVVGVEDDPVVGLEGRGEVLPEGREGDRVGDDAALVAAVVVRVEDDVLAARRDEVDGGGEVGEVGRVKGGCEGCDGHAFHEEGDAEDVVAVGDEGLCHDQSGS